MSGNSLAMMPWFPRDFLAATRAMRLAERGAYRELLDYQWEMGGLPTDRERLARLLGITAEEFCDIWPAIADKFLVDGAYMHNQRLEEHRKKAIEQRDRKRGAALATNAKRYAERPAERTHCASLSDTHTDALSDSLSASPPSPSPSPSPSEESLGHTSPQIPTSSGADRADARGRKGPIGTRIPDPFEVSDAMRAWAAQEFPNVDAKAVTAEFVDYWTAVPGPKGRKLDWEATWRNRVREKAGRVSRGSPGEQKTKFARAMEALDRA